MPKKRKVTVKCGRVKFVAYTQKDASDVLRFVSGLPRILVDEAHVDLNKMCIDFQNGRFGLEDYLRFYVGMGYSVSGFYEVFEKAVVE